MPFTTNFCLILSRIAILYFIMAGVLSCTSESTDDQNGVFLDFKSQEPKVIKKGMFPVKILDFLEDNRISSDRIIALKKYENKYYLMTVDDGIYVYNEDGKDKLFPLSEQGRGPREIMYPSDVEISGQGNYISVIDPGNRKILIFNKSGEYNKEVTVNQAIKNGALIDEDNWIFAGLTSGSNQANDGGSYLAFLFDRNGKIIKGFSEFTQPYQAGMGNGINLYRIDQNEYGFYSMFTNQIYKLNVNGMDPHYQFHLNKPLLPDSLIFAHMQGNVPLDDFVYFLSYFESEDILVLTYELDRRKYWSVYDKSREMKNTFYLEYENDCNICNKINVLGIDGEKLFVMVSSQMLERFLDPSKLEPLKGKTTDFEYMDYIIEVNLVD